MRKGKFKPVVIIFCLISILTFLFVKTKANNINRHHDVINQLHNLSYQDSLLNESVLEFRANRFSNYDPITSQKQAIENILLWIKNTQSGLYNEFGNDLDNAIDSSEEQFDKKIVLVERFKSHNGILKNSLYYLPTAIAKNQNNERNGQYDNDLNQLLRDVLLFTSRPNDQNKLKAYFFIRKIKTAQDSELSLIALHAETILREQEALQDIVSSIFNLATNKGVEDIYHIYERYNAERVKSAARYRTVMYAMAILLVLYMLRQFLTLRRTKNYLEESLYELAFQKNALDEYTIVASISPEGKVLYVNDKYTEISQYAKDDLIGRTQRILESEYHPRSYFSEMWRTLKEGNSWRGEIRKHKKDGSHYWVDATIVPFLDKANKPIRYIALQTDITDKKRVEERVSYLAHYDDLTNLPKRAFFLEKIDNELQKISKPGKKLALMFLDLDNFKLINDTLGHDSGDELLKIVASHLRSSVRESDIVSRLGGDEFTIALLDIESKEEIEAIARKILSITNKSVLLARKEITISSSIGISVYPDDASDLDSLLKYSDIAMYRAKTEGKNKFVFFTEELMSENLDRHTLENELRHAVQRKEFELYYQPQIVKESGEICAVEALIRWNHPEKGLIPPHVFIPVLEDSGLIMDVGKWVLVEACTQLVTLKEQGFNLRMSVNISANQLRDDHLPELIKQIIDFRPIEPHELELEITETSLLQNIDRTITLLNALSKLGVGLSLDDFGTGYSSLSYLKKLPIGTLKIDRSFVKDIPNDQHDMAIATTIIAMARTLDLQVVAEGVETEEQLNFLQENGCDILQGYYFSKPVNACDLRQVLDSNRDFCTNKANIRAAK